MASPGARARSSFTSPRTPAAIAARALLPRCLAPLLPENECMHLMMRDSLNLKFKRDVVILSATENLPDTFFCGAACPKRERHTCYNLV